jgi:hypothetical protein
MISAAERFDGPGLRTAVGDRTQRQFIPAGSGRGVGGIHNLGVKGVRAEETQAKEPGAAAAEQAGTAVRPVAEFPRSLEDLLPGGFRRAGRAAHHYGNQCP